MSRLDSDWGLQTFRVQPLRFKCEEQNKLTWGRNCRTKIKGFLSSLRFCGAWQVFSEAFLPLQLEVCLQASGLTGARGSLASSSQRCDVVFGPSPGAECFPAAQQLKVALGMQLEEPRVSGSEPKHFIFIVVLCGFGGRLHVNPGEALVPSQDGRGRKQAGCLEM